MINCIMNDELELLKQLLKKGINKTSNFANKYDFEDELSGNEIHELQTKFFDYAKEYMEKNYKGQYAIIHGVYCVSITPLSVIKDKNCISNWIVC